MGIEPTQNGTSALLTVLKTAEPTRTLPPPAVEILLSNPIIIIIQFFTVLWKALQPLVR